MSRLRERHDTKIYYSISEASAIAKVKPHVLRYWETQFKMLRPKKNKAGNRMYRKRDLKLIQIIKELLYEKGYTIAGAKRKLLDDRAALKEQLEITFTAVDRQTLLLEIIRDVQSLIGQLRQPAGKALAAEELVTEVAGAVDDPPADEETDESLDGDDEVLDASDDGDGVAGRPAAGAAPPEAVEGAAGSGRVLGMPPED